MSSLAQLLGRTPLSIQNIAGATEPYKQHTDMTIAPVNTATSVIFMSAFSAYQTGVAAALVGADKARVSIYTHAAGNLRAPFSLSVVDFGAMVRSVQRDLPKIVRLQGLVTPDQLQEVRPQSAGVVSAVWMATRRCGKSRFRRSMTG